MQKLGESAGTKHTFKPFRHKTTYIQTSYHGPHVLTSSLFPLRARHQGKASLFYLI